MIGTTYSKRFDDSAESVREARHWVTDFLGTHAPGVSADELSLAVSELVTNAVRYTGDAVGVTIYLHDCGVWVSVSDDGVGRVELRHPGPDETSGRGLMIVEELSQSWGVIQEREGKAIWFEFPRC